MTRREQHHDRAPGGKKGRAIALSFYLLVSVLCLCACSSAGLNFGTEKQSDQSSQPSVKSEANTGPGAAAVSAAGSSGQDTVSMPSVVSASSVSTGISGTTVPSEENMPAAVPELQETGKALLPDASQQAPAGDPQIDQAAEGEEGSHETVGGFTIETPPGAAPSETAAPSEGETVQQGTNESTVTELTAAVETDLSQETAGTEAGLAVVPGATVLNDNSVLEGSLFSWLEAAAEPVLLTYIDGSEASLAAEPVLEEIASVYHGRLLVLEIDLRVMGAPLTSSLATTPTFIIYRSGVQRQSLSGFSNPEELYLFVSNALSR